MKFVTILMALASVSATSLNRVTSFTLNAWGPQEPVKFSATNALFIDPDYAPESVFQRAKQTNTFIVCYLSVGTFEPFRKSAQNIPKNVLGTNVNGWNERWIRPDRWTIVKPYIMGRISEAKRKGCMAIESDNTDCYTYKNCPNRNLTYAIDYINWIARYTHGLGMLFGLKNSLEILGSVHTNVDFYINEECLAYNECNYYDKVKGDKKIFHVEYGERRGACRLDDDDDSWMTKYSKSGKWHNCF